MVATWDRVQDAASIAINEQVRRANGERRRLVVDAIGMPVGGGRKLDRRERGASRPVRVRWRCLGCGHESLGRTLGPNDVARLKCTSCGLRGQVATYSRSA